MKLFTLILIVMMVVGIVPSLILAGLSLSGVERLARDAAVSSLTNATNQAAGAVTRRLQSAYRSVDSLSQSPLIRADGIPRTDIEEQLRSALVLNPDFRDISLVDTRGRVRASVNYSFIGRWESTIWFQSALAGKVVVSDAHAVLYPFEIVFTVAVPVIGTSGEVTGVATAQVNTNDLNAILRDAESGFGGEMFVVNSGGSIVAAGNADDAVPLEPIPYQALQGPNPAQNGRIHELEKESTKYIAVVVPIDTPEFRPADRWSLVSVQPVSVAYAPVFSWRRALAITFVLAFVLVLVLSVISARIQTGQFRRIADTAYRIGQGDLSLNAQSSNITEIDDLAYAINSTAVQLREAIDAGRKAQAGLTAARDRLEIRVDERTVELQREIEVRREAEKKALSEQRSAEKANNAKSDFLANMSHELRTPLNHIIGFIELVNDPRVGTLSDVQKEYLSDALGSGQHLLSLINDVLDLAKVESGKMSIKTSIFDPQAMLESNIRSLEGQAVLKSISVDLECGELPETITADKQKLTQVMFNLLSNALKFTPSGGKITVRSSVVESSKQATPLLQIDVTDTGIGILQENLQRVFRPFEQVDSDRIRVIAGTGLGLALSQRLIDLHRGEIWAESPGPDLGSTFSFTIPI